MTAYPGPNPNPDGVGTIVRHPMELPITASCDTAWNWTRLCSDTSSTEMQCLRLENYWRNTCGAFQCENAFDSKIVKYSCHWTTGFEHEGMLVYRQWPWTETTYKTPYIKVTCIVTHLNNVVKSERVDFFGHFDKFKTRSLQTKSTEECFPNKPFSFLRICP